MKPAPHDKQKPGRKPLGDTPSVLYNFRMTPEQREKIDRIGGAPRLRKFIDKAKG